MTPKRRRPLRFRRMRGQHRFEANRRERSRDLRAARPALLQSLERASPSASHRREPFRRFYGALVLRRRVLLSKIQKLKRDRLRLRSGLRVDGGSCSAANETTSATSLSRTSCRSSQKHRRRNS